MVGLRTLELSLYFFVTDQVFMRYAEVLLRTNVPVAIVFPTEDSVGFVFFIVKVDNLKLFCCSLGSYYGSVRHSVRQRMFRV